MLYFVDSLDVSPEERFDDLIDRGDNELFRTNGDYQICYPEENEGAIEETYGIKIERRADFREFVRSNDGGEWVYVNFFNGNKLQLGMDDLATWVDEMTQEQVDDVCARVYASEDMWKELDKIAYEMMVWILEQGVKAFKAEWANASIEKWR